MSRRLVHNWVLSSILLSNFFLVTSSQKNSLKHNNLTVYRDAHFTGYNQTIDASRCIQLPSGLDNEISSINVYDNCAQLYKDERCTGDYIVVNPDTRFHELLSAYDGFNDAVSSIGPCKPECHPSNIERPRYSSVTVILYDHDYFRGNQVKIDVKGCVTIPVRMKGRASSIKVNETVCIELHEFWNCKGRTIQIRHGTPFYKDFGPWGFNDIPMSVSLCGYNCIRNESNNSSREYNYSTVKPNMVTIYSELNYQGDSKYLDISKGCANILDEWEGEAYSIQTYGQCVYLYKGSNCSATDMGSRLEESESDLPSKGFDQNLRSIESCENALKGSSNARISNDYTFRTIIFVIMVLFVLALVIASVIIVRLRRSHKFVVDILTDKEIEEFMQGMESLDAETGEFELLIPHNQAYDQNYEISRNQFEIDMQSPLGSGEYAIVYAGRFKIPNTTEEIPVAIKTIKPYSEADYLRAMLKEIKTMIYVGPHSVIVELVGCYTQNLRNGELFILTELCPNGALETFLQNHRETFVNLVYRDSGQILNNKPGFKGKYTTVDTMMNHANYIYTYLLQWSIQIADGMEYLAQKKVIHGDLATRNILLDGHFNTKISDFGLSRQLYEHKQYVKKNQTPLPWRWLAPESLRNFQFSTESDVWAFGITMWEMFALGDVPYPGMAFDEGFFIALASGFRLSKPKYATSECYNLMLSCWKERPSDRITFTNIRIKLEEFLTTITSFDKTASHSSFQQPDVSSSSYFIGTNMI